MAVSDGFFCRMYFLYGWQRAKNTVCFFCPKKLLFPAPVEFGCIWSRSKCSLTPIYKNTKTKREQPLPGHVYGEIWPHSLQFWLWHFFGSRLEPSCDHSFGAGLDLTCSPFRGLNSDDFPFFTSSLGPLEPELDLFKDLKENGDIWEISLTVRWLRLLMPRLYLEWDFPNVANFFYKYL